MFYKVTDFRFLSDRDISRGTISENKVGKSNPPKVKENNETISSAFPERSTFTGQRTAEDVPFANRGSAALVLF